MEKYILLLKITVNMCLFPMAFNVNKTTKDDMLYKYFDFLPSQVDFILFFVY